MYSPCEECFKKYGIGYTHECDDYCDYANVTKEKKVLEEQNQFREKAYLELRDFMVNKRERFRLYSSKGKWFFSSANDLKQIINYIYEIKQGYKK